MDPKNDPAKPATSQSHMQLDELFQRLKEHDSEWLERTLHSRWTHLLQLELKSAQNPRSIGKQTRVWPFDVTLPHVPEGQEVSSYIQFIRSYDWASTPLGPMSEWCLDLRRMVNMCLCDKRAAALWIGTEHLGFYNEAYSHIAGQKHPRWLGFPFAEMWPEPGIADNFNLMFDLGEERGEATTGDDQLFLIHRYGFTEEFWGSFSVLPIPNSEGGVFGCYNTVFDTTAGQVQARRLSTMLSLGQHTALATNIQDFWDQIIQGCRTNQADIPFAIIYSLADLDILACSNPPPTASSILEKDKRSWTLQGTIGLPEEQHILPKTLSHEHAIDIFSQELEYALARGQSRLLSKTNGTFPAILHDVVRSPTLDIPCHSGVVFPISPTNREDTLGFVLIGLNPLGQYDSDYQQFIELLARQFATSLASIMLIEEEANRARIAAQDRLRLAVQLAETKQEVIDSESRFRTMADLAPVAMFHLDEEGKVLYANRYWMDITQHPVDAWHPMSWAEVVHPEDAEVVSHEWEKLMQGHSVNFEMRWKRPFAPEHDEYFGGELVKGSTWTLASAYAERRSDGSIKGILGCLTDISRQKWMTGFQERRMKEAVEMKRQQDNFTDLISHEARNPLSAIMLCAESVLTTLKDLQCSGDDPIMVNRKCIDMQLESAEIIMACAQHQKRIIDDVLTISKLDSGLLVICPIEVQPAQLITQALKMFEAEVHKYDMALTLTIDQSYHDLDIDWVRLDPSRLLQVLINLITNAIKFTHTEPERRISVKLDASVTAPPRSLRGIDYIPNATDTTREERPPDDNAVYIGLEVADTGRGITPDEMKKLFQKFQQASPKTHVEYGGSGLGLFISRQLTHMQGGAIGVASHGKGATFAFYIMAPRCTAPHVQAASKPSSGQAQQERRLSLNETAMDLIDQPMIPRNHILVVEDNLVNQRVMRNQLERIEYAITVANHGLEALDYIRTTRFCKSDGVPMDIMLLDVEMPICNGLECAKRIRQMQRDGEIKGHVPIIGVTANARAEQQTAAIEAGMDAVVTKPFRLLELSAELEKIVKRFYR